tara:strand:- start:1707 stop:1940 length:234 start_codon:yes stop_codon:yes gene_type:complete
MTLGRSLYRLIGLDGMPHQVLDAPYESIEAAVKAASSWCNGQGLSFSSNERNIGVEVLTGNGSWRTIRNPSCSSCMR